MKFKIGQLVLFASILLAVLSLGFFRLDDAVVADGDPLDDYGFDRLDELVPWQDELRDTILLPIVPTTVNGRLKLDSLHIDEFLALVQNTRVANLEEGVLPISSAVTVQLPDVSNYDFTPFIRRFSMLAKTEIISWNRNTYKKLNSCEDNNKALLVLLHSSDDVSKLTRLQQTLTLHPAIIVYFGVELPTALKEWSASLLHVPKGDLAAQTFAPEVLIGAHQIFGENGEELPATRLGHAPPEFVGVDREKLTDIDRLVARAIRREAMPGCQILVAKGGKIIYDRNFGYHTYQKERAVQSKDLYDVASITKAAATTLGIMALEEDGLLERSQRLGDFFPDYKKSRLRYLRIRHLLAHHTGLQTNLPIGEWYKDPNVYAASATATYSNPLANDFFMNHTIEAELMSKVKNLRPARRARTKYGDVNFVLLQDLTERLSGQPMDAFLSDRFYEPMGLMRSSFRPSLLFDKKDIIPTENNSQWRGGLVRGIVHDEAAMLLNGVAGHAGLFSNAEDLANIFQMLNNGGTYGGHQYFSEETVESYISKNGYNYRAFGFDRLAGHSDNLRRYGASKSTFGHTGFTGGCVWADPDNDLVYIFLSNRIHPNPKNDRLQRIGLRERIHKIIYKSF